jgi:hypothetical protein
MKKTATKMAAAVPQTPTAPGVAPQPKPDPLRVSLSKLPPKQEQDIRAALLSKLTQQLTAMCTQHVQEVARFAVIVESDQGCASPAEEFITSMAMHYYHGRGLTPDDVVRQLEHFREDFDDAVETTVRFNAQYPAVVKAATTAA